MLYDLAYLKAILNNDRHLDIFIKHSIQGMTFRRIAKEYGIDSASIFSIYKRTCVKLVKELNQEIMRMSSLQCVQNFQNRSKPALFYEADHISAKTMESQSIRAFVIRHCSGLVLDVFAGLSRLEAPGCTFITNDINKGCQTQLNLNAGDDDFPDKVGAFGYPKFNTIILDPPFSLIQARRHYEGHWYRNYTFVKDNIDCLASSGTKVISLGFNSTGMGKRRGYDKLELLIVNLSGSHNDIFVLVEKKQ